ncbi:MAG: PAS domain S-box protein [Rhodospirillaceae bacterium]
MDAEQIAAAFRTSRKGVVITGVQGHILAVNPAFCKLLGYSDIEIRGGLAGSIIPAEDCKARMADWARVLAGDDGEGEGEGSIRCRYLHHDGHVVNVIETRTPVAGKDGVTGVFALIERDFQPASIPVPVETMESDRFFRRIFEVAGEAIFVADAETGVVVNCNQHAADLIGRSRDDIIGTAQSALHPDDERDHYRELFSHRAQQSGRQNSEVLVRRVDGLTVPVEITSTTMGWNGRLMVIGIFKEITERRRTEAALLAFANRMHAILSSMFDAVITADEQGTIETFNDAAERLFGWRAYEVIGRGVSLLMPPQSFEQSDAMISGYRRGSPARIVGKEREVVAMRKDGSLVPIELAITEVVDRAEHFGTGASGRRSFVGVIRDITERKTIEAALLAAKSQAELANRAKSEFLAHMSHELRTPLNAIIGFSEILMRELFGPLAPRYCEYAETIYESGQHLLRIINDLLDMARIEAGRFDLVEEAIDLHSVIESCLTMVRARADHGQVDLSVLPEAISSTRILADRRSVMQVLLNLLTNSVKFTPRGGVVSVTAGIDDSGRMVVSVADTGPGIDTDMLPRLFEPFQQADSRLSRKLEGTGLGLAISRNLMELHGGALEIESRIGVGTVAIMRFPASRVINPVS